MVNRIGVELIITLNGSQSKLIRRIVIAYIAKQKPKGAEPRDRKQRIDRCISFMYVLSEKEKAKNEKETKKGKKMENGEYFYRAQQ